MADKVPNPTPLGNLKSDLRALRKARNRLQGFNGFQYTSGQDATDLSDIQAAVLEIDAEIEDLQNQIDYLRDHPDISTLGAPMGTTVTQKNSSTYGEYCVVRVHTGKFIPSLVGKAFGGNFETTGNTGSAFIPPGEQLTTYANRFGASVVSNASGWNVTNNIGEMRGLQIKSGVMYHDFDNFSGSPAGRECIALMPDGHLQCFSRERGDTGASVLAAGAVHTWCYGPNLVINGVKQDIDSNPTLWKYFASTYTADGASGPEISARTIIGQSSAGDIILISTVGKTNVTGLVGNQMCDLAAAEGCYNASLFDGGGSAQQWVNGFYTIPSSDDQSGYSGTFNQRAVGDCLYLRVPITSRVMDTPWIPLVMASGFKASDSSQIPAVRQLDGTIMYKGQISPNSGNFGTSSVTIAQVPQRFQVKQAARAFRIAGDADNDRKVALQSGLGTGSLDLVSGTDTPAYLNLAGISHLAD